MHRFGKILPLLPYALGPVSGAQVILNGSFETGLSGWTTQGAVSVTSEFALIEEAAPGGTSALFQSVALTPGPLLLATDLFVAGMSASVPSGALADTAFGTLYLGDSPFGTDATAGSFDEEFSLFDLDRDGLTLAPGVTATPLANRPNWVRLTARVETDRSFATFVAEEIDLNFTAGDSVITIDNVTLFIIPEPATGALAALAISVLGLRRTRPT